MKTELRTQVRIPLELANWLKGSAEEHDRSMNSELIAILKARMKEAQKENAPVAANN